MGTSVSSRSKTTGLLVWKRPRNLCWQHSTSSLLSRPPPAEPVPLPDRGEEQRRGEDPPGERRGGLEGLLWRRVPGDSGWVRHEIWSGVHLSGHDVSTTSDLWPFYLANPSLSHWPEWRRPKETQKESRRRGTVIKMSPQQNESFQDYRALID